MQSQDFSRHGTKLEGQWENDRNAQSRKLFTDIIREAFGTDQVIIAHHLVYSIQEDDYFLVEEIPSADALIFDHAVMQKLFPANWGDVLTKLALTPPEGREAVLGTFYYSRQGAGKVAA